MNSTYPSGRAAMFAGHARNEEHTCTRCLWGGTGELVFVNGWYVLNTHQACMAAAAEDQSGQCCCYELMGDNAKCPLHGTREEC